MALFEDNINVKIGRVLFEKQDSKEIFQAAYGLKQLFDEGGKKDAVAGTMAVELAVAAYFEGCPTGAALAAYCMLDGTGYRTYSDLRIPFEVYTEAGMEGDYECAYNLAVEYDHGYPPYVPQNPFIASYYFTLAADSGSARAQFEMGNRYFDGTGVEIDFQQAEAYWEAAAQQGVAAAQYNLGCLLDGSLTGGPSLTTYEPERAGYWLEQAARNGHKDAAQLLNLRYRFNQRKNKWEKIQ